MNGQSISPSKITRRAAWQDIATNMRHAVIYAVKPSWVLSCAAVEAWLRNQRKNFIGAEVASVNLFISLPQKNSPTFVRSSIAQLSRSCFCALLGRLICVSLRPSVAAFFSNSHTLSALIGQSQHSRFISDEYLRRGEKLSFASVTKAKPLFGSSVFSCHVRTLSHDGPHFQLPWNQYP